MKAFRDLEHLARWRLLGALAIVAIVILCLVPVPRPPLPAGSDKIEHALAWLLITLWYAQLMATPRALLARACGFIALGALIEVAQSLTWWRTADPVDVVANMVGVAIGTGFGLTSLGRMLMRFDGRVEREDPLVGPPSAVRGAAADSADHSQR